ncbi:hypothetical protein Tco_1035960 [Tanacetum coccineum]
MAIGTGHRSNNYSESKRNDHLDNNRRQEQRNKGIPNKSHPNFREEHSRFHQLDSNYPIGMHERCVWIDLVVCQWHHGSRGLKEVGCRGKHRVYGYGEILMIRSCIMMCIKDCIKEFGNDPGEILRVHSQGDCK